MSRRNGVKKFNSKKELKKIIRLLASEEEGSFKDLSKKLNELASLGVLEKVLKEDQLKQRYENSSGHTMERFRYLTLTKTAVESVNFPDEGRHEEFQYTEDGQKKLNRAKKICLLMDFGFHIDAVPDHPIKIFNPNLISHVFRFKNHAEENKEDCSFTLKSFVNRRAFLAANYEPETQLVKNLQIAIGRGDHAAVKRIAAKKKTDEEIFDNGEIIQFALMRLIENSNPALKEIEDSTPALEELKKITKQYEKILRYLLKETPKHLLESLESTKFPHPEITFVADYLSRMRALPSPFSLLEIAYKCCNIDAVRILHESGGLKLIDSTLNSDEELYRRGMLSSFATIMTNAIDDPELLEYTIANHAGAKIFTFFQGTGDSIQCKSPFQYIYMDDATHQKSLELLVTNVFGAQRKAVILAVILGKEKAESLLKTAIRADDKINTEELRMLMICFGMTSQDLNPKQEIENPFIKELAPRIIAECDELALEFTRLFLDRENHFSDIAKATEWIGSLNELGVKLEAEQLASTNSFLAQPENQEFCDILRLKPVDLMLSSEFADGKKPIIAAIESGDPLVVEKLLASHSKPEELAITRVYNDEKMSNPVIHAARMPEVAAKLFETGIDILPSLFLLIQNNDEDTAVALLNSYYDYLIKSEPEMAKAKMGLLINSEWNKECLLTFAIKYRLPRLTEKLIELGADVNRAPTNKPGSNPLMSCCYLDKESEADIAIAKLLTAQGASHIALPDSNFSALHVAAIHGNSEKFKLLASQSYFTPELINSPIAKNYKEYTGKTLLEIVCNGKNPKSDLEIAKILISKGAHITPQIIRIALSNASLEIVQLIWENATEAEKSADIEPPKKPGYDLIALPITFAACRNPDIRVGMFLLDQEQCDASQIYYLKKEYQPALGRALPIVHATLPAVPTMVAKINILHHILMSPKNSEEDVIKIMEHVLEKFPMERDRLFSQATSINKESPHSILAIACDNKMYKVASYLLQQGHRPVIVREGIRVSYEIDTSQRLVIDIIKEKINSLFEGESHDSGLKDGSEEEIRQLTSLLHHIVIKNDKEKDNQLLTANILRAIGIDEKKISLLTGQKSRFDGCLTMDEAWMVAACLGIGPDQFGKIGKEIQPSLFQSISQDYKVKGDYCAEIIAKLGTKGTSKENADKQIKLDRILSPVLSPIEQSQAKIAQELQDAKRKIKSLQEKTAKLDPQEQERVLAAKEAQKLRDQEEAAKIKRAKALDEAEKAKHAARVASWRRIAKEKEANIAAQEAAAQKAERDRIAAQKAAAQKAERDRIAAQKAEKTRIAKEKAAAQKAERDRIAAQKAKEKGKMRQQEKKAETHYNSKLQRMALEALKQNVSELKEEKKKENTKKAERHFNKTLLKKHFDTYRKKIDARRKFKTEVSSSSDVALLKMYKGEENPEKLGIIEEVFKSRSGNSKASSIEAPPGPDQTSSFPTDSEKVRAQEQLQRQLQQNREQLIASVTHNGELQGQVISLEKSMTHMRQENDALRYQIAVLGHQLQMLHAQHQYQVAFYHGAQPNPASLPPQDERYNDAGSVIHAEGTVSSAIVAHPGVDRKLLAEQHPPPSASPESTAIEEGGRKSNRVEGK